MWRWDPNTFAAAPQVYESRRLEATKSLQQTDLTLKEVEEAAQARPADPQVFLQCFSSISPSLRPPATVFPQW